MRSADRKRFADALAATFAVYGHTLTPDVIRIWWNVLDGYKLDAVLSAMSYHVADHEGHGYRLPTPADVRKHLEVTLPRLAADTAAPAIDVQRVLIQETAEAIRQIENDIALGIVKPADAEPTLDSMRKLWHEQVEHGAHLRALAKPAIREDDTQPIVGRNWLPPFLRRGIALLTGK